MEGNMSDTGSNRRTYIKRFGAGVTAISGFGLRGSASSRRSVRIPVTKGEGEVIRWAQVPRKWIEQSRRVRKVVGGFKREYLDKEGVAGAGVTVWKDKSFGDLFGQQIVVEIYDDKDQDIVPDEFQGVSVKTRVVEPPELTYCHNLTDFNPIPGGVTVEQDNDKKGGTSGFIVKDQDSGSKGIATANHLWAACEDNYGKEAYQNHDYFGDVGTVDQPTDFATAYTTSSYSIEQQIEEESTVKDVNGYKTEDGVSKLVNDTVSKMGTITGLQTGELTAYKFTPGDPPAHCIDYRDEGIKFNIKQGSGDSGCPVYAVEEDSLGTEYASIIGHAVAGQNFDGEDTVCDSGPYNGYDEIAIYEEGQGAAFYKVADVKNVTVPTW